MDEQTRAAIREALDAASVADEQLAVAQGRLGHAVNVLTKLLDEDLPPAPKVVLTIVDSTSDTISVEWSTTGPDPGSWTIGRDRVDTHGTPAWAKNIDGGRRDFEFSSLLPGTEYTITLSAGSLSAQVKATTAGSPVPQPDGDGIQAAMLQGWGERIDGDEFDRAGPDGRPLADRWGLYVSAGHGGNGRRVREAWTVRDGICVCAGDAAVNSGGMAFTRWSGLTYRVEARMQLVELDGDGKRYHPCLILWPDAPPDHKDDWPWGGEDDIAETDMGTGRMKVFIHHPRQWDGGAQETAEKQLVLGEWNNYAAERTRTSVTGWINGVQWFRFTNREVLNPPRPFHPTAQLDANSKERHRPAELRLAWYRIYRPPA